MTDQANVDRVRFFLVQVRMLWEMENGCPDATRNRHAEGRGQAWGWLRRVLWASSRDGWLKAWNESRNAR